MVSGANLKQTPRSIASDVGLHCLLGLFCLNIEGSMSRLIVLDMTLMG